MMTKIEDKVDKGDEYNVDIDIDDKDNDDKGIMARNGKKRKKKCKAKRGFKR